MLFTIRNCYLLEGPENDYFVIRFFSLVGIKDKKCRTTMRIKMNRKPKRIFVRFLVAMSTPSGYGQFVIVKGQTDRHDKRSKVLHYVYSFFVNQI